MKGQITVFLSLVFTLIAAVIGALINSARDNIIRSQIEIVTNAGLYSVFGEYNRELFDQYDLLFIDTGYGKEEYSLYELTEHLNEYIEYNNMPFFDLPFLNSSQLFQINIENVGISNTSLATDERGAVYYDQAIAFMKSNLGLELLEFLMDNLQMASDNNVMEETIGSQRVQMESDISSIEDSIRTNEEDIEPEEKYDVKKKENPSGRVNQIRASGVMQYIFDKEDKISRKLLDESDLVSKRVLNSGSRIYNSKNESITDKILFGEYILKKFSNYLSTEENKNISLQDEQNKVLQYEVEYILADKNNDYDNLSWIVNRLLLIREVCNFGYLLSDGSKVAQAHALAVAIVGFTGIVPLIELTKYTLLFAWAYVESIQDVKNLMAGGNIPLIKTSADWSSDLNNLYNLKSSLSSEKKEYKNGIDYLGYLRILLFFENRDSKIMHSMNLIEQNLRKTTGNVYFKMDNCIGYIETTIQFSEKGGREYEIIRSYGYDESYR